MAGLFLFGLVAAPLEIAFSKLRSYAFGSVVELSGWVVEASFNIVSPYTSNQNYPEPLAKTVDVSLILQQAYESLCSVWSIYPIANLLVC